ncbi:MAG TPA: enoyl-CoA hydratase-related protein, partial [Streptosporangiaceae bacterium]
MPETRKTFGDVSVWPSGDLVATVEIGRPPDNFFDVELITSLADACAWLDEQPEFRAAVLCSDGKHFCAGADFTGRSGRTGTGGAKELYAAAARLFEVRTPVVAAVQGAAVGGGLGLACAADFRVASPQA